MKKYKLLVRGENFLMNVDGEDQKLGFYATAFVEALDEEAAEQKALDLLRSDQKLKQGAMNGGSDVPQLFVEEIQELASFEGFNPPKTGFAFFREAEAEQA